MKKWISFLLAVTLTAGMGVSQELRVKASEEARCIDGSYLLDDATFTEGEIQKLPRGYYLKSGTSSLVEKGVGKVGVGGSTSAYEDVNEISVYVKVQRLVNGNWQYYHTWSAKDYNSGYVGTSKLLNVPQGYYYRVCCDHFAATDSGSSNTDGLFI